MEILGDLMRLLLVIGMIALVCLPWYLSYKKFEKVGDEQGKEAFFKKVKLMIGFSILLASLMWWIDPITGRSFSGLGFVFIGIFLNGIILLIIGILTFVSTKKRIKEKFPDSLDEVE